MPYPMIIFEIIRTKKIREKKDYFATEFATKFHQRIIQIYFHHKRTHREIVNKYFFPLKIVQFITHEIFFLLLQNSITATKLIQNSREDTS